MFFKYTKLLKERSGIRFMKLLVMILNKVDKLDDLLEALTNTHIRGATILDSNGMAHTLFKNPNKGAVLGSIRDLINPDHEESKTILMVLRDDQIKVVEQVADQVLGSLDNPDTGFIFTVPVDYIRGIELGAPKPNEI